MFDYSIIRELIRDYLYGGKFWKCRIYEIYFYRILWDNFWDNGRGKILRKEYSILKICNRWEIIIVIILLLV